MTFKIYLDKKDINDATSFYISIIQEAIESLGQTCPITHRLSEVMPEDIVVTVKVTSVYRLLRQNKRQDIVLWIQGVQPEEMLCSNTPFFKKMALYTILRYLEWLSLKKVKGVIFISDEMHKHYRNKYHWTGNKWCIMPCFNILLEEQYFFYPHKYDNLSFVYAGSLDKWQCFDDILQTFKAVQTKKSFASLTVLTKDAQAVNDKCRSYGLENVSTKYVPKESVGEELSKYKFGFILRDNILVNRVATPTKINSYMASGVIPVISTCLVDFASKNSKLRNIVWIDDLHDYEGNAARIIDFHARQMSPQLMLDEYRQVFCNYYGKTSYISHLINFFKSLKHE